MNKIINLLKRSLVESENSNNNNSNEKVEILEYCFAENKSPMTAFTPIRLKRREALIREYLDKDFKIKMYSPAKEKDLKFKEASNFSQLLRQLDNNQLGIISADKMGDTSQRKNLENDLRRNNYGFTILNGGWVDEETQEEYGERSYLVVNNTTDFDTFQKFMIALCNKYNQDAVYLQNPEENLKAYYTKDGEKSMTFDKNLVDDYNQQYFSSLRNKKHRVTFA